MVVMVTSRACSLHDPTRQDFINAHPTHIYVSHAIQILKNLQSTLCKIEYNQEGTPKMTHMLIF